jgi:hypothetical protein
MCTANSQNCILTAALHKNSIAGVSTCICVENIPASAIWAQLEILEVRA